MARKAKEQIKKERQSKATIKFVKNHYKRLEIRIHKTYEKELITFLESKDNKQAYIKNLILEDMKRSKE